MVKTTASFVLTISSIYYLYAPVQRFYLVEPFFLRIFALDLIYKNRLTANSIWLICKKFIIIYFKIFMHGQAKFAQSTSVRATAVFAITV